MSTRDSWRIAARVAAQYPQLRAHDFKNEAYHRPYTETANVYGPHEHATFTIEGAYIEVEFGPADRAIFNMSTYAGEADLHQVFERLAS